MLSALERQHDAQVAREVQPEAGGNILDLFAGGLSDPELGDLAVPGIVPTLSASPGEVAWLGPGQTGAHNDEVYSEVLGLTPREIETPRAGRVI